MTLDDEAKRILAVSLMILIFCAVLLVVKISNYGDFEDECARINGEFVQAATEKLCMRDGDVINRE